MTVHHDLELTVMALLELDRYVQSFLDQCSETRRIRRGGGSCVAIHYSNGHPRSISAPTVRR